MPKLVYDLKLRRPGCVILQAALAPGSGSIDLARFWPTSLWLVAPTPDLVVYPCTREQARWLAEADAKIHRTPEGTPA